MPDIWYMTPDNWHMLSPGTSTLDLILWHLTGYYCTWHLLHIHDYHCYGDLARLLYCYQIFGTPVLLNSCAPELLYSWTPITGRFLILFSWCHTLVDPRNWLIMDVGLLCIHCGHYHWTIYIIKYSTYTGMGETDEYWYDVIIIMVDISEVSCGARNDKCPKAVAWSLKCRVGRVMISPQKQCLNPWAVVPGRDGTHYTYEPSDLSVSK